MSKFKSLIVLDLETSNLPGFFHSVKITELALYGCETKHLHDFPRVLHKLILCFNPGKMIDPKATEVSGLSNEDVESLETFKEADANVLHRFISRLPSPVCIVAHNGNKFDFPILKKTLDNVKLNLPNSVYCADSLEFFRNLYSKTPERKTRKNLKAENETTPKMQKTVPKNSLKSKQAGNEVFNASVCRELFPDVPGSESPESKRLVSSSESSQDLQPTIEAPNNLRLQTIYSYLFKINFEAHKAENDSEALLKCLIKVKPQFLNWIQDKAVNFNEIKGSL